MSECGVTPVAKSVRPLEGIVVLDVSTIIGGPLAATILGEYGARVIKVEDPRGGDGARRLGMSEGGEGSWWSFLGKGKECVTCRLSTEQGRDLFKSLVARADVVIENFRPGTMERWGLGFDDLRAVNHSLVMLRLTGFGQDGPYAPRPGYGTIAEAMSGFAGLTGFADGPPVLPGVPIADSSTGFAGALACMVALFNRQSAAPGAQQIDLSLYSSLIYSLGMFFAEFQQTGNVPTRRGNRLGNAPRNAWQCSDGEWIAYSGQSPSVVNAMVEFLNLTGDSRFATITESLRHGDIIDELLGAWIAQRPRDEVVAEFIRTGIPIGPVNSISDLMDDQHLAERGDFAVHYSDGERTPMLPVLPFRITSEESPAKEAASLWVGRDLGADNEHVYVDWLGLQRADLLALAERGVI